jgi:phosphoglycerate kinase
MDKVLKSTLKPFTAIMGGAKVSDKIMVIENLLPRVNNLIIAGGMAYTFVKAKGGQIGKSLCEEDKLDLALSILEKAKANNVNVVLPVDAINADKFDSEAATKESDIDKTPDGWMGLDIGPKSIKLFTDVIMIQKPFSGTGQWAFLKCRSSLQGPQLLQKQWPIPQPEEHFPLLAEVIRLPLSIKINWLIRSVMYRQAAGAMLEYIEGKELPGIKAITRLNPTLNI